MGADRCVCVSGAVLTLFFIWRQDLLANILAHAATDAVGLLRTAAHVRQSGQYSP
jgi:hypothetical protein